MIDGTNLPKSARDALIFVAIELSRGFEGEIRLRCGQGGAVRRIHFEKTFGADEFGDGHLPDASLPSARPDP